jgi:hypothetical protein
MVRKNLTNNEIYGIAMVLLENEVPQLNLSLPVKVNFYLQKNVTAIVDMAKEIEATRNEILQQYGKREEDGNYTFEDDNLKKANQELADLFALQQEVPVYEISLDAFDNVELTSNQVKAISYMIKEEEE